MFGLPKHHNLQSQINKVPLSCSISLQVEKIRQLKAKSLYLQVEKLHQSLTKLDSTIAAVSQVLDEGRHLDVLLARERMLTQIHELKALRGLLQPQEDDRFMFTPPDQVSADTVEITSKWSRFQV